MPVEKTRRAAKKERRTLGRNTTTSEGFSWLPAYCINMVLDPTVGRSLTSLLKHTTRQSRVCIKKKVEHTTQRTTLFVRACVNASNAHRVCTSYDILRSIILVYTPRTRYEFLRPARQLIISPLVRRTGHKIPSKSLHEKTTMVQFQNEKKKRHKSQILCSQKQRTSRHVGATFYRQQGRLELKFFKTHQKPPPPTPLHSHTHARAYY